MTLEYPQQVVEPAEVGHALLAEQVRIVVDEAHRIETELRLAAEPC